MFDLSLVWAYLSTTRALDSVPRTHVEFPRLTAIDKRCRMNDVARLSYVLAAILLDQTNGLFAPCTRRFDGHRHKINATDDILVLVTLSYLCVCRSRTMIIIIIIIILIIIIIVIIIVNIITMKIQIQSQRQNTELSR